MRSLLLLGLLYSTLAFDAAPSIEQLKSRFLEGEATQNVPDAALGQYSILSNGWPGQLTLNRAAYSSQLVGTIQYHNAQLALGSTPLPIETLDQITFSNRYGGWYVKFHRPAGDQWYWALFDQNFENINGHFTSGNGLYNFDATRAGSPRPYSGGIDESLLGGSWSITSNGWPGTLTFTTANAGKIQYDSNQSPFGYPLPEEAVSQAFFVNYFNTWYTKFFRPAAGQWYWGIVEKNLHHIHGHFTGGGAQTYAFDATRAAPLPGSGGCPVPAFFAGDYAILSNGWPGRLSLPGDLVLGQATITYDNTPLPGGTTLPTEPVTALTALRKYDGWYLYFYRPKAAQFYWAVFDESTQSLHGHFSSGQTVYEFVAQKLPTPPPPPPPAGGNYYV